MDTSLKCSYKGNVKLQRESNFLSSPVPCSDLLLPGGVLVEDLRVSHNNQQRTGSRHCHIEPLQNKYIIYKKQKKLKRIIIYDGVSGAILKKEKIRRFQD